MIQFILNNTLVQLDHFQPNTTLLDYLRLNVGLCGSKEGCASGDCGACTVVVAELNTSKTDLEYSSLNSCICLLGTIHGKQIITVEGLRPAKDKLHPVQQSLVDKHASQCGFCTPGFVMSLFAMSKQGQPVNHNSIIENIDGNLCRCTGYRPIIDAAKDVLASPYTDHFDKHKAETVKILQSIAAPQEQAFICPNSVEGLSQAFIQNPTARLVAGGTDLVLDITQGLQQYEHFIYLGNIDALKQITETENNIHIGTAVSYEKAELVLSKYYPDFRLHLQRLGSKQIRNVGTIGGNVANASPIGDMPPALVALDASLLLQKGKQQRTVKINDFYTAYKQTVLETGEFLREIIIPKSKVHYQLKLYKISKRHADDISAICAAFYVSIIDTEKDQKITSIRIAMGGMAATVKRADNCEKALLNQVLTSETLEAAKLAIGKDYQPLDDVRASREYRVLMAQNLLQRLFLDCGMAVSA